MNNLSDYKYPEFNEDFEGMVPVSGSGGSGGGPLVVMESTVVFVDGNANVLDKTYNEIMEAMNAGRSVVVYRTIYEHGEVVGYDTGWADRAYIDTLNKINPYTVSVVFARSSPSSDKAPDFASYLYRSSSRTGVLSTAESSAVIIK